MDKSSSTQIESLGSNFFFFLRPLSSCKCFPGIVTALQQLLHGLWDQHEAMKAPAEPCSNEVQIGDEPCHIIGGIWCHIIDGIWCHIIGEMWCHIIDGIWCHILGGIWCHIIDGIWYHIIGGCHIHGPILVPLREAWFCREVGHYLLGMISMLYLIWRVSILYLMAWFSLRGMVCIL